MSANYKQPRFYRKAITSYVLLALLFAIPIGCVRNAITEPFLDKEMVAKYEKEKKEQEDLRDAELKKETEKHIKTIDDLTTEKLKLFAFIKETKTEEKIRKEKLAVIEKKLDEERERYKDLEVHQFIPYDKQPKMNHSIWFKSFELLVSLLLYGFLFYNIYRQKLSFDEQGVWAEVGIFPWTRGYIFIEWSDIERVGYSQNPIGFFFGSSNVHIIRRYSGKDIVIKSIFRGKEFSGVATSYKYRID